MKKALTYIDIVSDLQHDQTNDKICVAIILEKNLKSWLLLGEE